MKKIMKITIPKIIKNDEEVKKEYREELKTSFGLKRYKIQEVIKPGQVILIQVIKEERGQKGAALQLLFL